MEMLIGCIFLGVILLILFIFCKNVNLNINITYSAPKYLEIKDRYDAEGNPVEEEDKSSFDTILKEVNSLMLGEDGLDE